MRGEMKEDVKEAMYLIENEVDNALPADMFELLNELNALIHAVRNNPEALADALEGERDSFRRELVVQGICPECGADLEDEACENVVPYGDTYVIESACIEKVCSSCGYREER